MHTHTTGVCIYIIYMRTYWTVPAGDPPVKYIYTHTLRVSLLWINRSCSREDYYIGLLARTIGFGYVDASIDLICTCCWCIFTTTHPDRPSKLKPPPQHYKLLLLHDMMDWTGVRYCIYGYCACARARDGSRIVSHPYLLLGRAACMHGPARPGPARR
jgi:hypothetical protein